MDQVSRAAVLIDCENISRTAVRGVLAESARHGTLSVKRGYGDWTRPQLEGWRPELHRHAIQPVQQFAHVAGKNATDSALIIDAMDLLYAGQIGVFVIVSSDSDFTRLGVRLRESGRRVLGIGARHTPEVFRNACDRFTYLDLLPELDGSDAQTLPAATPAGVVSPRSAPSTPAAGRAQKTDRAALGAVIGAAIAASADEDGWAQLSTVGQYLVTNDPTFDSRDHGYAKLGNLVSDLPRIEVARVPMANGSSRMLVRAAQPARTGS